MAYQLRERDPLNLEDMQKGALRVETNLNEKRARMKTKKRVSYRDEAAPSTSDSTLEMMMERMSIYERAQSRENQSAPQNINQSQNQN